jgi:cysteine desulfurase family protein (TIGR01976 family)
MTFDLSWVRAQFPGLDPDVALFDNAGGSVPARGVTTAIARYLEQDMVQLGASYPRSRRATERVRAAYAAGAELVRGDVEGVVFNSSTTMNMHLVAQALAPEVEAGDEVVVTELDHEANRGAWCRLAEARGATLRTWRADGAHLTAAGLDAVLSERTKLVAFTHCANVVGALHDAAEFCARIRRTGALSVVDGVAFAPHRRVDVTAIGADVYALSLYKVFGPHLGLAHLRPELLARIANQNHFFVRGQGSYELMPGNVCHELAASVGAIVDYLRQLDRRHGGEGTIDGAFACIRTHEAALVAPLLAFLSEHPRVRVIGPTTADPALRVPTVAFTVDGMASAAAVAALDGHRVAIRFGHFYAYRAMQAFGLEPEDGVVRVSMAHYNSPAEVTRLIEALDVVLTS